MTIPIASDASETRLQDYEKNPTTDPFGNVIAGDAVELEVCLVDGSGDTTPSKCVAAA